MADLSSSTFEGKVVDAAMAQVEFEAGVDATGLAS
jgi:hypothetical protein